MSRISDALQRVHPDDPWRLIAPRAVTEESMSSVLDEMAPGPEPAVPTPNVVEPAAEHRVSAPSSRTAHSEPVPPAPAMSFTFDNALTSHLVLAPEMDASVVEQYRKLATVLHQAQSERNIKVIMVAGAMPADGKTLTATNLALTLSGSFRRKVLLIDADLRKPSLQNIFVASRSIGLCEALAAEHDRRLSVLQPSPHLSVLLGGTPTADPVTMLSSERMKRVLEDAAAHFDWVILDTPPAATLPDVRLLSSLVDGALLVVRAGVTPFLAIERSLEALGRDRILGVVLNAAEVANVHPYGYAGYGYGADSHPSANG